ncbi:MAG: hypothetical protein ABSF09_07535 [Candidatus Bathyarchaeia archaeon]
MQDKEVAQTFYADKLKRAIHLLLFKRGKMPGAKEWELKEKLGKNFEQVIEQLNQLLSELDLEIKKVKESSSLETMQENRPGEMTRYYITLTAYLLSKQGKAPRDDLEKLLSNKFGKWKAVTLVEVFLRTGYLEEDDAGVTSIGWRTQSEVDLKALMTKMAEVKL